MDRLPLTRVTTLIFFEKFSIHLLANKFLLMSPYLSLYSLCSLIQRVIISLNPLSSFTALCCTLSRKRHNKPTHVFLMLSITIFERKKSIHPRVHPHLKDPRFWLTSLLQPYFASIGAQGNCALTFAILPT
jgi:hypothetical protein